MLYPLSYGSGTMRNVARNGVPQPAPSVDEATGRWFTLANGLFQTRRSRRRRWLRFGDGAGSRSLHAVTITSPIVAGSVKIAMAWPTDSSVAGEPTDGDRGDQVGETHAGGHRPQPGAAAPRHLAASS